MSQLLRAARVPRRCRLVAALAMPLLVLVGACGEAGPDATPPTGTTSRIDGRWELVAGSTAEGPIGLDAAAPVTLDVDGTEISGSSGCNHYGATLDRDGDRIGIGRVGGTEMACEPHLMELEQGYLAALQAVGRVDVDADRLVLTGTDVRLEFHLVADVRTAGLVGTVWALESLLDGDTASSTVGGTARLVLTKGGTFTGSTGCRPFVGRYVLAGGEVRVTRLGASSPSVKRGVETCPPATAAQDDHVLTVLGDGFRVEVDGATLTLSSHDHLGLVYRAQSLDLRG